VRRAAAVAALAPLLAGCGGGGPLAITGAQPPAGAQPFGKRAARQGSNDTDANKPVYRLSPREGQAVSYAVTVRNTGKQPVEVTGVNADASRDGVVVPHGVEGAPVGVAPGAQAGLTVTGTVRGCARYAGQIVPMAGPELRLRGEGGESRQQLALPYRVDVLTAGCAP
jgi:hypothetical protein